MVKLCESTWIKHGWKFMRNDGIEIKDYIKDVHDIRENDITISSSFALANDATLFQRASGELLTFIENI